MAFEKLTIDHEYIASLLDARGYHTDDLTVNRALQVWLEHVMAEEDNHFLDVLEQKGVELEYMD